MTLRNMFRIYGITALTVLLLGGLTTQIAYSQVLYGSIVGSVTDPEGAAIPNATITATSRESNQIRKTTTNQAGSYSLTTLPSGAYEIQVSMQGFATFSKRGVSVTNNNVSRVDVTLKLGTITESVMVTASPATLQTDRAEVRQEVNRKELADLPLPPGRNYATLFGTLPGISPPIAPNGVGGNPTRAMVFTANGVSRDSNNTRIDGATVKSTWLPYVATYTPSLEAIESVDIVTNSFDAEQGLAGGAAVNVQIKSGGNRVHGSLFEFHTDNKLKARPFFLPFTEGKPKLVDNQFGGTLGGPIRRDKLFFFGSYEAINTHQFASNASSIATVPTAAMRAGDLSASPTPIYDPATGNADGSGRIPFSNNVISQASIDPIVRKLVDTTPLPNLGGLTANYFTAAAGFFRRTTVDSKVNWNASSKVTVFGRFGAFLHELKGSPVFDQLGGPSLFSDGDSGDGATFNLGIGGTYVFSPTFVVDANFGWSRKESNILEPRLDENVGLDVLGIPGTNGTRSFEGGVPQFRIDGFTQLGSNSNKPFFHREPNFTYVANANWIKGTHNIRFGTDISNLRLDHLQAEFAGVSFPGNGGFVFTGGPTTVKGGKSPNQFNSFGAYLLGLPQQLGKIQVNADLLTTRTSQYSFYIRDQWQATRKLTLNYGLRYEYYPMPTRADRGLERYDAVHNQTFVCGVGSVPSDCGVEVSKTLFAPRLGLAYRPTETFVIRAGYGISYDPLIIARELRDNFPSTSVLQVEGANSFSPAGRLADGIPIIPVPDLDNGVLDTPGNQALTTLGKKFRRGYIQSFNFTLQKELKWGLVAQAAYVGSRQVHLNGLVDLNVGQVGGGSSSRPLYQSFGRTAPTNLEDVLPGVVNHYDALQTMLKRRFASGYEFSAAYTWSKSTGIAGPTGGNPRTGRQPLIYLPEFWQLNKAVAEFDRTHAFSLTGMAELPFGKGKPWLSGGGLGSLLAGGWQINSVLTAYSGLPFSVLASGNSLNAPGNTQRADQVKPAVKKPGGTGRGQSFFDPLAYAPVTEARFGTAGFNSLRGPGLANLDFGLFRKFQVTERFTVQFRAEAFNLTNTPHFANPGNNVSNLQLNSDGSIRRLGGFTEITSLVTPTGRDFDERQFRLGLRISF